MTESLGRRLALAGPSWLRGERLYDRTTPHRHLPAVRAGKVIVVTGTAPLGPDGGTVAWDDQSAQTRRCLEIVRQALEQLGAGLSDVIRTRILLTRIEDCEEAARVHGEFLGEISPVNTMMQVTRFIDADWLRLTKACSGRANKHAFYYQRPMRAADAEP